MAISGHFYMECVKNESIGRWDSCIVYSLDGNGFDHAQEANKILSKHQLSYLQNRLINSDKQVTLCMRV